MFLKFIKKLFLKILQYPLGDTCVRVSFYENLQMAAFVIPLKIAVIFTYVTWQHTLFEGTYLHCRFEIQFRLHDLRFLTQLV